MLLWQMQRMGRESFWSSNLVGLINYPFYMTFLFVNSMQNLVLTVATERENKLDQGMFMVWLLLLLLLLLLLQAPLLWLAGCDWLAVTGWL